MKPKTVKQQQEVKEEPVAKPLAKKRPKEEPVVKPLAKKRPKAKEVKQESFAKPTSNKRPKAKEVKVEQEAKDEDGCDDRDEPAAGSDVRVIVQVKPEVTVKEEHGIEHDEPTAKKRCVWDRYM